MLAGMVKEGINLWGPAFMSELRMFDLSTTLAVMSFVPIMSLCSSIMIGFVNKLFGFREKRTMILFFAVCAAFLALLYINIAGGNMLVTLLSFGIVTSAITGACSLITVFIPLNFRRENRVSTAAGFVDCAVYMGAALSGPLLGAQADSSGWGGALLLWIGITLLAIILAVISRDYKRLHKSHAH
jgi:OPA family glycerol-3-phosphate transporter-like MFS transporter